MGERKRILSTRVRDENEQPVVPGSIKRPCVKDNKHMVWVSSSLQPMLGSADPMCVECLQEELKQMEG